MWTWDLPMFVVCGKHSVKSPQHLWGGTAEARCWKDNYLQFLNWRAGSKKQGCTHMKSSEENWGSLEISPLRFPQHFKHCSCTPFKKSDILKLEALRAAVTKGTINTPKELFWKRKKKTLKSSLVLPVIFTFKQMLK